MKLAILLFFLMMGEFSDMTLALDFNEGTNLAQFLDQCADSRVVFNDICGSKKCSELALQQLDCGMGSFLNSSILLQSRVIEMDHQLMNLSVFLDNTRLWTETSLSVINADVANIENDLTNLAANSATIGDVSEIHMILLHLNATVLDSCASIVFLVESLNNHSTIIDYMCSELTSYNQTIETIVQDIQSCELKVGDFNSTLQSHISQTEHLQECFVELRNTTDEIIINMACIEETANGNTAAISNLTVVVEELIASMSGGQGANSEQTAAISSLENATAEVAECCARIQEVEATAFAAIEEIGECLGEQKMMMEVLNCSVTERLDDIDECWNETLSELAAQAHAIYELEACLAEQIEANSNLSARVEELEMMNQIGHDNTTDQSQRIDELESLLMQMQMMLMTMNASQLSLMGQIEMLENQVNEQNCSFMETLEVIDSRQEIMENRMEEINCTIAAHNEKICHLDNCLTSFMALSGYKCVSVNDSTSGAQGREEVTTLGTITTQPGASSVTSSPSAFPISTTTAVTETSGACGERLTEIDQKLDSLLASIPDCPAGFISIYRDEDRESHPLCIKFEMTPGTFTFHEHYCQVQGLRLAEIEGNYTLFQLSIYAQGNPVISNCTLFVGATDKATEGEWMWLSGTPLSDMWNAEGSLDGGATENCALFNAEALRLESADCEMTHYAMCMI